MIRAVGTLLARDGFQGMGVNALAREAGVDKVLIYRYFGSLDTLIDRYCQEVDFWPTADELISYDETAAMEMPPSERLALIVKNLGRAPATPADAGNHRLGTRGSERVLATPERRTKACDRRDLPALLP
ncbi:MAG: TetR/AcrR family transcriptional regulator [Phycisphaerales bacterium]